MNVYQIEFTEIAGPMQGLNQTCVVCSATLEKAINRLNESRLAANCYAYYLTRIETLATNVVMPPT